MVRPKLTRNLDEISLDHVTLLLEDIHEVFHDTFGDDETSLEDWDAVRIRDEMAEIFEPYAFQSLFSTRFGKGVIIGAWIDRFIINSPEKTGELFDGDEDGYSY